jgi:hypothetical protein
VDLRAGLDTEARGKVLYLYLGSNLGCPVCSQTLLVHITGSDIFVGGLTSTQLPCVISQ